MKAVLLITFTFLTSFICQGQKEYLRPAKEFYQSRGGGLNEYYNTLLPLLYENFTSNPYARYTSIPSFSPEYAFSVEERNDAYIIISNHLSESYWYSKNRKQVKVITSKTTINKELYEKIGELFRLLTSQIQEPESGLTGGVDGVSYYFSTVDSSGRLQIGKTWSPSKKTLFADLIKICDKLYSIGNGNDFPRTKIQEEIQQLIDDLEK